MGLWCISGADDTALVSENKYKQARAKFAVRQAPATCCLQAAIAQRIKEACLAAVQASAACQRGHRTQTTGERVEPARCSQTELFILHLHRQLQAPVHSASEGAFQP